MRLPVRSQERLLHGQRGFEYNLYFKNGTDRGFLDVVNKTTQTIYDFKFGGATMSSKQFTKYTNAFPGFYMTLLNHKNGRLKKY